MGATGAQGAAGPQGPAGADGALNAWGLQGNAGTDTATHFIGTTDFMPLRFRINGEHAGLLSTNGTTSIGRRALMNDQGVSNTAFGAFSGYENESGSNNLAVGYRSLFENRAGGDNVALGKDALGTGHYSSNNVAVGSEAMYEADSVTANVAIGAGALRGLHAQNNDGSGNVAVGYEALTINTSGTYNVAIGYRSLYSTTTSATNVGVGAFSLADNTDGQYNTAIGHNALNQNTAGDNNTALGHSALKFVTLSTNSGNTGVGRDAGNFFRMTNSTYLGNAAFPVATGYTNAMGLGYNARPDGSNKVHVGNTSITSIRGQVGFTTYSDGRFKTAVREDVKGLDLILKLRPVTYNVDAHGLAAQLKEDVRYDSTGAEIRRTDPLDVQARDEQSRIRYTGFIAQEVEAASRSLGYDFSGVDRPASAEGLYGLRYADFVVPLVKAVQEQQAIIEQLKARIEELEKR